MSIAPRFFAALGTVPHAERLAFLTQDVRAAGTVFGFYGAAAAIGARPTEMALIVVRRYRPEDLHRQVVLVFQQDRKFAEALSKLYAANGKPLGFEGQYRWCAIPEPSFMVPETFALLAQRFPTLLMIEEQEEKARIVVYGSEGFKQRPPLKLAPLPKPAPAKPQIAVPPPRPKAPPAAAKVVPLRPFAAPPGANRAPLPPLPLSRRRRLRSVVALNEKVERQVVNEFRRLLTVLAYYG